MARLPVYLKKPLGRPSELHRVKSVLRQRGLHTVCEEARCPNIGECFAKPTATFMILGDVCTRRCGFCSVEKHRIPLAPDPKEPENIALAVKELGLKHVVITSVTRDDLADGGALQFVRTIRAVRRHNPGVTVEVLTPDFGGNPSSLEMVLGESPDVFNHNLETVKRLYPVVRPGADYLRSLRVLEEASSRGLFTKSGIMVGLGEDVEEVKELIRELSLTGCTALTIGQYLRPGRDNLKVQEFVPPELFREYELYGRACGIRHVYSGPFVRSSYNAEEVYRI